MTNKKITIAILCGGIGSEREVSLKSGQQVLNNLPKDKYLPELVEITKEGTWLLHEGSNNTKLLNPPTSVAEHTNQKTRWDIVFIALHGTFGEDGRIQGMLDLAGIPYTGSGVLASALGMDKTKAKKLVSQSGVRCPKFLELHEVNSSDSVHKQILKTVKYPCVVKPNSSGSSVGVSIVKNKTELAAALEKASREKGSILIEEYVKGREVTCGVMGNNYQEKLTPMPPVEIVVGSTFFDYHAKYESVATEEICPAPLSKLLTKKVQDLAMKAHEALGCDGLTRSDFIIKGSTPYFLEINTIPGLTEQSLCPKEAKAMGMSFGELLDKMVEMGLKKSKNS